jgi:hypothetical protein
MCQSHNVHTTAARYTVRTACYIHTSIKSSRVEQRLHYRLVGLSSTKSSPSLPVASRYKLSLSLVVSASISAKPCSHVLMYSNMPGLTAAVFVVSSYLQSV